MVALRVDVVDLIDQKSALNSKPRLATTHVNVVHQGVDLVDGRLAVVAVGVAAVLRDLVHQLGAEDAVAVEERNQSDEGRVRIGIGHTVADHNAVVIIG